MLIKGAQPIGIPSINQLAEYEKLSEQQKHYGEQITVQYLLSRDYNVIQ